MSAQAGRKEQGPEGMGQKSASPAALSNPMQRLDLAGKILAIRAKVSEICQRALRELENAPHGHCLVDCMDLRAFYKLIVRATQALSLARQKVFFAQMACGLIPMSDEERARYLELERQQEEAERPRPKAEKSCLADDESTALVAGSIDRDSHKDPQDGPDEEPHVIGVWLSALKKEIATEKRRLGVLTRALRQLMSSSENPAREAEAGEEDFPTPSTPLPGKAELSELKEASPESQDIPSQVADKDATEHSPLLVAQWTVDLGQELEAVLDEESQALLRENFENIANGCSFQKQIAIAKRHDPSEALTLLQNKWWRVNEILDGLAKTRKSHLTARLFKAAKAAAREISTAPSRPPPCPG